jgi:hypothetical protein
MIQEHSLKGKVKYSVNTSVWKDNSASGWTFASLPIDMSKEIRALFRLQEDGWGRMKIIAQIGSFYWDTSIWFDTKSNRYLLPLNLKVRKHVGLSHSDNIQITLHV